MAPAPLLRKVVPSERAMERSHESQALPFLR